jgi:hypothetical protein
MTLRSLFEWVDVWPSSIALRESLTAYPLLLTLHVVSMCLFAGIIIYWDLRLVGLALNRVPVSKIPTQLFPYALTGFALNLITGSLLVYSQPMRYFPNFYFWFKMGMMLLAGINMVIFHMTTGRAVEAWDRDLSPPTAAKVAGVASLALWAGVVITGRMIAYSGLSPQWWLGLNLGN